MTKHNANNRILFLHVCNHGKQDLSKRVVLPNSKGAHPKHYGIKGNLNASLDIKNV